MAECAELTQISATQPEAVWRSTKTSSIMLFRTLTRFVGGRFRGLSRRHFCLMRWGQRMMRGMRV